MLSAGQEQSQRNPPPKKRLIKPQNLSHSYEAGVMKPIFQLRKLRLNGR